MENLGTVELTHVNNRWGIELSGSDADKIAWKSLLKPPFDPFIEEVKDEHGEYLALRSIAFDEIETSAEVHRIAKTLFKTLNVAMAKNADTDQVINGLVVEFVPVGPARRHHYLEAEGITMRLRVGVAELSHRDKLGNIIAPPPMPSKAQLWMRASSLKPEIGSALRYLEGKPGWVELYKAYEAIQEMPNGGISKGEIKRFTQTANVGERHHPNNRYTPHKRPMNLWEARTLLTQWISAAIEDVLSTYGIQRK